MYESIVVHALQRRSALEGTTEWDRATHAIDMLLLLLDDDRSDAALGRLVDLSSFYFGEHTGEILDCVISRKGRPMEWRIRQAIADDADRCVSDFGLGNEICRSAAGQPMRERLEILLSRIEQDLPCEIEM